MLREIRAVFHPPGYSERHADSADKIIEDVFAAARSDERASPLVEQIRDAYETGEWNAVGLADAVERATASAAEETQ